MYKFSLLAVVLSSVLLLWSCNSKEKPEDVRKHANEAMTVSISNGDKIFVSNVYKDKELAEVYLEKKDKQLLKLSDGKQNISSLLLSKDEDGLFFSQSQNVSSLPKPLESLVINAPSRFSHYRIMFYDFKKEKSQLVLNLSDEDIVGTVANMAFLHDGRILAFQTNYGKIYFVNLERESKVVVFDPKHDFMYSDFYKMRTDGKSNLIFDAVSGYKSNNDRSFVYNTFKYNLDDKTIERITDHAFYSDDKAKESVSEN